MAQRSMLVGTTPNVVIRASENVQVEGWDQERVFATTDNHGDVQVERKDEREFAHIRARVGPYVLLDVGVNRPGRPGKNKGERIAEVSIAGSARVAVPRGSRITIYAGQNVVARDISGTVTVYAGGDARIRNVSTLVRASVGGSLDLDCDKVEGQDVKFGVGKDARCRIRNLVSAQFLISDVGGYWEVLLGDGRTRIRFKAGGEVTLVTDQEVRKLSPNGMRGRIEKPDQAKDYSAGSHLPTDEATER